MKSKFTLIALGLSVLSANAAELPDGMQSLLPSGVKANISTERKLGKQKNLVVAGSPQKGYYAFFAASDGTHGEELWVTDGTPAGTRMVKDINPGVGTSDVSYLTRFNDKVVFSAYTDDCGQELWISDGTEEGTYQVADIHFAGDSSPRGFTQVNENQVVFAATDFDSENYSASGSQMWLWVTDGTEDGTKLIAECNAKWPGQDNTSWMTPWMRVGRKVFFKADTKENKYGGELWVTDGTEAGTYMIKDINTETIASGTADAAIDNMVNFYNEKLFFKAFSIESNNEPWVSDGTPEGTFEIYDSNPTFDATGFPRGGGASDCGMFPYNGKVYFRGFTLETGCELAATNCEKNDFKIFDINTNTPTADNNSYADVGVEFDGVYVFCAATGFNPDLAGNYGGELVYTDGETVTMPHDYFPGTESMWIKDPTVCGGSLYWWNEGGTNGSKTCLWRIDNKDQRPEQVTHFNADGDMVHTLRNMNGTLLFATDDNTKSLYSYTYRKADYNANTDADVMEPEYRTREEIKLASGVNSIVDEQTTVAISPNPASTYFHVKGAEALGVEIYDITGALVLKSTSVKDNTVSIASLAKGVYVVNVETAQGIATVKLIVR